METSYLELKQKEVVNLCDGKRLGKVCDVVFTFPEGKTLGIVVPGTRGFRFGRAELFIALKARSAWTSSSSIFIPRRNPINAEAENAVRRAAIDVPRPNRANAGITENTNDFIKSVPNC